MPALFDLQQAGLLARRFGVLGFSRSALSDEDFRESLREGVQQFARHKPVDERAWQEFSVALHYQRGQFDDPSSYRQLADRLAQIDREHGTAGNGSSISLRRRRYSLSSSGSSAPLGSTAHATRVLCGRYRKPFGTDLESARQLNHQIQQVFTETQVYRIDHYLGKETVQNILAFRPANGIFEPIWNRNYVDHVQITVAETDGVGTCT